MNAQSSSCILKCKHMTLAISMLDRSSPCILICKTIITSRPRQGRVRLHFYPSKGVDVKSKNKDMTMGEVKSRVEVASASLSVYPLITL